MEDTELVQRAREGDEVAFELLVRRHLSATWRLARLLLSDGRDAEEAVQDTFVKAHGALGSYRGESTFRAWLLAICRRTCIDRLRLVRRDVVSLDVQRHQRANDERHELRLQIEDAMEHLPAEEREAFMLVDVLGYSREEAAAVVDAPSSTMRSRVSRGRRRLADLLTDADSAADGS
jgi:RNA polymerase sigma-70 factor, ECF subfamily